MQHFFTIHLSRWKIKYIIENKIYGRRNKNLNSLERLAIPFSLQRQHVSFSAGKHIRQTRRALIHQVFRRGTGMKGSVAAGRERLTCGTLAVKESSCTSTPPWESEMPNALQVTFPFTFWTQNKEDFKDSLVSPWMTGDGVKLELSAMHLSSRLHTTGHTAETDLLLTYQANQMSINSILYFTHRKHLWRESRTQKTIWLCFFCSFVWSNSRTF